MADASSSTRPTRERKQVEVFSAQATTPVKQTVEVGEGKGIPLGEYAYFVKMLEKRKADDDLVKNLHNLMFGAVGTKFDRKKNIRKFSGFTSGYEAAEKLARVDKMSEKKYWRMESLKDVCELFGMEKKGTRVDLIISVLDYLYEPKIRKSGDSAVKAKTASKKRKSTSAAATKEKKPKKAPGPYMLYCAAERAVIKRENPDATFAELSKLVGAAWQALSAEDKTFWQDKANALKTAVIADLEGGESIEDALNFSDEEESGEEEGGEEEGGEEEEEDNDGGDAEED